jgi:hypothetical protein
MYEFIRNIIPRIQSFSKRLDQIEVFVDRSWILVDENNNKHEYNFLRDNNQLIMSLNGKVKLGSWKLLPTGKLLIERGEDALLLDNAFIDKAILILKKGNSDELPFILFDDKLIPDGDIVNYLIGIEKSISIPENTSGFLLRPGYLITKEDVLGNQFTPGAQIINNQIHDGYFPSNNDNSKYLEIKDNKIFGIFFHKQYHSSDKSIFKIKQKSPYLAQFGDQIIEVSEPSDYKRGSFDYEETNSRIFFNENGVVKEVKDLELFNFWSILLFIILIFIIVGFIHSYSK